MHEEKDNGLSDIRGSKSELPEAEEQKASEKKFPGRHIGKSIPY